MAKDKAGKADWDLEEAYAGPMSSIHICSQKDSGGVYPNTHYIEKKLKCREYKG